MSFGKYDTKSAFGRIGHYVGVRENRILRRRSGEYDTTSALGRI
jgi:hypothetical protein